MTPSRSLAALVLTLGLGAAACSDDGGTQPEPEVDRIVVTPDDASVTTLGATAQFSAQALTSAGAPLTDVEFSWTTSNGSVATVDASGRAMAVGFGEATITATAGGKSAGAIFSVRDCTQTVSLAPGAWTALAVPAQGDCGLILPAGADGDRYRVAVVRTVPTPLNTDVQQAQIDVVPLGSAVSQTPSVPTAAPRSSEAARRLLAVPGLLEAARTAERTALDHADRQLRDRELIRRLGPENALRSAPRGPFAAPAAAQELPATLQIDPTTPSGCTPAGEAVTAIKIWENDDLAFYQDESQVGTSLEVTVEQVQRMGDFWVAYGKDVIDEYFGGVPDIDGNGKIIVFISPVVASGTAAFVWSGDYFTKESCPASNEGEYIYFSASLIQSQDDPEGANWQSLETLVHETKHNSSLYNSIQRPLEITDPYHPSWEEEGSAEIAGNVASRIAWAAVGGPAMNARVTDEDIIDTGFDDDAIRPEFYGVALRLLRVQGFLSSQPNGVVGTPSGAASGHSIYGTGWTFLRWLGDGYGAAASSPMAEADLFLTLNSSATLPGIDGLEATTGKTFARLMEEFAAAIMLHSTEAPPPARAFTSYDFVSAVEVFCFAADNPSCQGQAAGPTGSFPWAVTTNSDGTPSRILQVAATYAGPLGRGGIRVHDFVSNGTGTGAELVISAPSQSRIVVARIR